MLGANNVLTAGLRNTAHAFIVLLPVLRLTMLMSMVWMKLQLPSDRFTVANCISTSGRPVVEEKDSDSDFELPAVNVRSSNTWLSTLFDLANRRCS